jgi:hypothetical protein
MDNTCNTQALTLTAIFNSFTNKLGDTMYLKPELNDKIEFGQDLPVRIRSNKIRTNFWLVFNKYDKAAQIVAGHFGGILIDDSTKKDIVITDGFFDWHSNVLLK